METLVFLMQILILVGIWLAYRNAVPAYLSEKGKHLATKQDIAEITRRMEEVKLAFRERAARFSMFQQKQFEVVGGVYERLFVASERMLHMVHPVQYGGDDEEEVRRQHAADAYNGLAEFYGKHKIYLPENICDQMDSVLTVMKRAYQGYHLARDRDAEVGRIESWNEAYQAMKEEVPKLQSNLEQLFREQIAVPALSLDGE